MKKRMQHKKEAKRLERRAFTIGREEAYRLTSPFTEERARQMLDCAAIFGFKIETTADDLMRAYRSGLEETKYLLETTLTKEVKQEINEIFGTEYWRI